MHYEGENHQIYHTFAVFDPPEIDVYIYIISFNDPRIKTSLIHLHANKKRHNLPELL